MNLLSYGVLNLDLGQYVISGSPYNFICIVERTSELLKSQARSAGGRPPVVVLAVNFRI